MNNRSIKVIKQEIRKAIQLYQQLKKLDDSTIVTDSEGKPQTAGRAFVMVSHRIDRLMEEYAEAKDREKDGEARYW